MYSRSSCNSVCSFFTSSSTRTISPRSLANSDDACTGCWFMSEALGCGVSLRGCSEGLAENGGSSGVKASARARGHAGSGGASDTTGGGGGRCSLLRPGDGAGLRTTSRSRDRPRLAATTGGTSRSAGPSPRRGHVRRTAPPATTATHARSAPHSPPARLLATLQVVSPRPTPGAREAVAYGSRLPILVPRSPWGWSSPRPPQAGGRGNLPDPGCW